MERKNSSESRKKAATELFNVTKIYVGSEKLPTRQLTQTIEGLIIDLEKQENTKNIKALGINDTINELKMVNSKYKTSVANRAESQINNILDNARILRKEVDLQYDEITTRAFVASVATPSEEANKYVSSVNKLIDDINTAYKQRKR